MKKARFNRFGPADVLQVDEVAPPQPRRGEVLVRVAAAGLNPKDILIRKGKFRRLSGKRFPQGVGFDVAGTVTQSNGTDWQAGTRVFGMRNGWHGGTVGELVAMPANELSLLPEDTDFSSAAGVPLAGQTALQALRDKAGLTAGQMVCINGGSGGVGTLAIQIAKILGAHVTTISSGANAAYCRSLGADETFDYADGRITATDRKFDVFFDVFGNYSFDRCKDTLRLQGRYVTTVPSPAIFKAQLFNLFRGRKARLIVVKSKQKDLRWLSKQMAVGKLRPQVDRIYPLEEIQAAQLHIESKRSRGKVIVTI